MSKLKNEGNELERFWHLVHEMTSRLVGAQAIGLDEAVDDCLRTVGEFFHADQVGLAQRTSAGELLPTLRTWGRNPPGAYLSAIGPGPEAFARLRSEGALIWNNLEGLEYLEDLPRFREHLQQVNAISGIFSLYRDYGSHTEHLAVAKTTPTIWPKNAVECLASVGEILFSALHRRRAEIQAEKMLQLQLVISDVAVDLGRITSDDSDAAINETLKRIGTTTDADLVFFVRQNSQDIVTVSHRWVADILDEPAFLGARLADNFPWLASQLKGNEPLLLSSPGDFPSEAESELSANTRIQSIACAPFQTEYGAHGYVVLAAVDHTAQWPDGIVAQLGLIGQILINALDRSDMDSAMAHTLVEIQNLKDRLVAENETLWREIGESTSSDELVGKAHTFRSTIFQAQQVAATDSSVLLLGETGTGKGLVARKIHEHSRRSDHPLITINCAALPPTLIESELFGHEKGAFTGAITRKIGRFELADGGTIFLDEVGDLPIDLQAKLLRVLQDQQFERLGSSITQTVDVRVIAATNRDLDELIAQDAFRADLYYRLGVFPIRVPPLRERRSDIPLLVWFFISELQHRLGRTFDKVSDETMGALTAYEWPGNVRELRNIVERAMILSRRPELKLGSWFPGNSGFKQGRSQAREKTGESIAEVERAHIINVLELCDWKIRGDQGAAERLGLKRTTLQSRMKKLGISRPTF